MSLRKIVPALLLADFAAFTAYVVYREGFSGIMSLLETTNLWFWQIVIDLVLAVGMVSYFMTRERRKAGQSAPIGYLIAALFMGSLSPLLYMLIGRPDEQRAAS